MNALSPMKTDPRTAPIEWRKQGKLFQPDGAHGWMNSHAQIPTVLVLEDRLRVYFATRPQNDLTLTTFVDLDRTDPKKVIYIHDRPVLELGKRGMFDSHGLMPNYVTARDGRIFLYYVGWYRGSSIPYHNAVGLAVSDDGGITFQRLFDGPILDRTPPEPYSMGSISIVENQGVHHMFYTYVFDWLEVNDKLEPIYHIRHATSEDGIEWKKSGRICIKDRYRGEAVARPSIVFENGVYHMWFCYRGSEDFRGGRDSYRIGYASSVNLLDWERDDDLAGITVSESGWDSAMITYPCVVEVDDHYFMFYNGNGFGASGFGYAIGSPNFTNERRQRELH